MNLPLNTSSVATQRGLSLVEIMVALTIGLIVLAAVSQIFVTSRSTFTLEEGLARVQENGRFAIEFLSQDIRMAGYAGCSSKLALGTKTGSGSSVGCSASLCNIVDPPSAVTNFPPDGISAHRYVGPGNATTAWEPDLSTAWFATGDVKAGTDVIVIQRASTLSTHLTGNAVADNANIQILDSASIQNEISAGDILIVSDCKSGDVFRATNRSSGSGKVTIAHSQSNPGNTENFLTHSYDNTAELMKLVSRAYYIGTGVSGEPALKRKELVTGGVVSAGEELIEGVEEMRMTYGQDTDGDGIANIYRLADAVTDWSRVVSVRVGLLMSTLTNVDQLADTKTYELAGIVVDPPDTQRRRQAYNTTIQLRN